MSFTDGCCFTRKGMTNSHTEHISADENPNASLKLTCGQNCWQIYHSSSLPPRLNDFNYPEHLVNLPELFDELPLAISQNMWFMHHHILN